MPAKAITKKQKVAPVVKKEMPVAPAGTKFWLTLAGLIAGSISFIAYIVVFVLLQNLNIPVTENVQIISIFVLSVLAIGALVVSVLAILPGRDGDTTHKWLGLNIIAFGISFLMFDKFVSALISVITYLLTKKAA